MYSSFSEAAKILAKGVMKTQRSPYYKSSPSISTPGLLTKCRSIAGELKSKRQYLRRLDNETTWDFTDKRKWSGKKKKKSFPWFPLAPYQLVNQSKVTFFGAPYGPCGDLWPLWESWQCSLCSESDLGFRHRQGLSQTETGLCFEQFGEERPGLRSSVPAWFGFGRSVQVTWGSTCSWRCVGVYSAVSVWVCTSPDRSAVCCLSRHAASCQGTIGKAR